MMSMEILQCPTPFIIGIPREYCRNDSLPEDACVVDLDNDFIQVPQHLHRALCAARRLSRAIDLQCRPELHNCDSVVASGPAAVLVDPQRQALEIIRLCKQFIADMMTGMKECCYVVNDKGEELALLSELLYQVSIKHMSHYAPLILSG